MLALQRSAGNAAVRRLLQRDGWPEARKGGFNREARSVAGTLRVPITGLSIGYKGQDVGSDTPTTEHAGETDGARAVVVVPDGTDFAGGRLEVLLLFHGLGVSAGIGYRERSKRDKEIGDAGTVHDLENDLISQQLNASGRNMIAILAQGRSIGGDRFGIPDPPAYVGEVLVKLRAELAKLKPDVKFPASVTPYRIASAGHSGGGPPAVAAAEQLQKGDWHRQAPLVLFDAINGPKELKTLRELLTRWLEADRDHLLAAKDPAAELAGRGLKFRSTYSVDSADVYQRNHEGGRYVLELISGQKLKVDISRGESVNGFLDDWFTANAVGKLAPLAAAWRAQYVTEKVSGSHHHQIGTGVATPSGRDSAGVPQYTKGTGHLEKALRGLP